MVFAIMTGNAMRSGRSDSNMLIAANTTFLFGVTSTNTTGASNERTRTFDVGGGVTA